MVQYSFRQYRGHSLLLGSNFGGLLLEQTFCRHSAAFPTKQVLSSPQTSKNRKWGLGKQGYGNRPPIDEIGARYGNSVYRLPRDASKKKPRVNSHSSDSPLQRIKEKSRYGISVSTPHRRYPKGPKIEKIQDRPPGLKFSSAIENFKRAAHQTPIFCGKFGSSEIEIFNRD